MHRPFKRTVPLEVIHALSGVPERLAAHVRADEVAPPVITVRAGLPEGGYRGHHQRGVKRRKVRIVQAEPLHFRRRVALNQDIRPSDQPIKDVFAGPGTYVKSNPQLIGIEKQEQAALLGMRDVAGNGPQRRALSPRPGFSSLITPAPRSASNLPQYGAELKSPNSSTFRPPRAPSFTLPRLFPTLPSALQWTHD